MKKALMNASVASMIYKFNMNNIEILEDLGYQVDVACNFGKENPIKTEEIERFRWLLNQKNVKAFETDCPRSLFALGKIFKTYKQLKKIAVEGNYDIVHTQSPIGGVICRLAFRKARKKGTKVIYTAHGFHFFKGAPLINWLIYYPVEKLCSYFTDVLITINKEDFALAKKRMKAKKIVYVPGVGIDLEKLQKTDIGIKSKREELGIPENNIWLLNIGELIHRKNQETLIRAISNNTDIYLTIVGKGELMSYLNNLINELKISDRVKLLGFRTDIYELCQSADLFVFPSFQEGLPVALMEAMACGLPCVVSNIRGNIDLIDAKGGKIFNPRYISECSSAINQILLEDLSEKGEYNKEKIKMFSNDFVAKMLKDIYKEFI